MNKKEGEVARLQLNLGEGFWADYKTERPGDEDRRASLFLVVRVGRYDLAGRIAPTTSPNPTL